MFINDCTTLTHHYNIHISLSV